jgi:fumarylacetoacetase
MQMWGKMFRDPENALLPNWLLYSVGYHGRSSPLFLLEFLFTDQYKHTQRRNKPFFGPSRSVDFELETAFITTDVNIIW